MAQDAPKPMTEPSVDGGIENPAPPVPGRFERAAAVFVYLGFSPFLTPWLRSRRNGLAAHHARQADALFLLLSVMAALFLATVGVLSLIMLRNRTMYTAGHFEGWTLSVFRKLLIVWAVFWVYGLGLALFGSRLEIPWVGGIGRLRFVPVTRAVLALAWMLAVVCGVLAARGSALAPEHASPSRACMLYEDVNGRYPRWLFALGYYPAIEAAHRRWGKEISLRRLTRENLVSAMGEAEFLFIGSHGMAQGMLLQSGFVTPADLRAAGAHPRLRYVYLAGCDSGALKREWEEAFAPAQVVTQASLTPLLQHIGWLWLDAPKVIRGM